RGRESGAPAEHEEIRKRIAAEAVGAVHPGGDLPCGVQPVQRRGRRVRVDADAAHDVVERRTDLHRLLGDVDVRKLLELVVHRREAPLDVVGRTARGDGQAHADVLRAAPGYTLLVDL